MKKLLFILVACSFTLQVKSQAFNCTFKEPLITISFGSGRVPDLNTEDPSDYRRVLSSCPTDGHYTYTPFTSDCFRGDWVTLTEDHTPGDAAGNMMIVNASPRSGAFLKTTIIGLKKGATYEFSVWMLNVCRPTDKCPFPLLPDIGITLQTPSGKIVSQFSAGELQRREVPQWNRYQALFTATSETTLLLTMTDNAPGGCGNDFAVDDISVRECIKTPPVVVTKPKVPKAPEAKPKPKPPIIVSKPKLPEASPKPKPTVADPKPSQPVVDSKPKAPSVVKQKTPVPKPLPKKNPPVIVEKELKISEIAKPQADSPPQPITVAKPKPQAFPAPPPVLRNRTNLLIKQIETPAGEISLALYDNGEIDGDTVSVYHNNVLLISHARISDKPLSFKIVVDAEHPHHEFIMVAENLGSIPPNTSLMVVTAGTKRYEVFISSSETKNAKVILDLKE